LWIALWSWAEVRKSFLIFSFYSLHCHQLHREYFKQDISFCYRKNKCGLEYKRWSAAAKRFLCEAYRLFQSIFTSFLLYSILPTSYPNLLFTHSCSPKSFLMTYYSSSKPSLFTFISLTYLPFIMHLFHVVIKPMLLLIRWDPKKIKNKQKQKKNNSNNHNNNNNIYIKHEALQTRIK